MQPDTTRELVDVRAARATLGQARQEERVTQARFEAAVVDRSL